MRKQKMMREMYPNLIMGDGILSDLSDFSVPWRNADISTTFLDMGYYSRSAQKIAAPIVIDISDDSQPLDTEQRTQLAGIVFTLFNRKWERFWNVLNVEYNPISNYDMTETESIEIDVSDTHQNTGTVTNVTDDVMRETGTVTNVSDNDSTQTGTVTDNGVNSVESGIFGFNSSDSVGANTSDGTVSNTRTDNLASTDDTTETRTDNLTKDRDVSDTETRNLSDVLTGNRDTERTLTRSGNIGVTTSQQMIESELELWQWNFFKSVYEDIDSICCLDVY